MKILDRYFLWEFLRSFLGVLSVFSLLILLHQILGILGEVSVENPDMYQIALYFIYVLPGQILQVVPISAILAVMFGIGALAKRKELLAVHASGVSYLRLAIPLGVAMFAISIGVFVAGETLVPACKHRARYIEKVVVKGRKESVLTRNKNVTTRGKRNVFYTMKSFDSVDKVMENPIITELADNGYSMKMRLDADRAEMVTHGSDLAGSATLAQKADEENLRRYWRFHNAVRRTFDENGAMIKREEFRELEIPMEEDLERFLATNKKASEMNFSDLRETADIQAARGKGEYYFGVRTELYNRLSFPFAAFLLGMIGYTFAVRSSIRSFVLEFGVALVCAALYYTLMILGHRAGTTGFLPPAVASWYTDVLFFSFTIWRFWDLHQVPRY